MAAVITAFRKRSLVLQELLIRGFDLIWKVGGSKSWDLKLRAKGALGRGNFFGKGPGVRESVDSMTD